MSLITMPATAMLSVFLGMLCMYNPDLTCSDYAQHTQEHTEHGRRYDGATRMCTSLGQVLGWCTVDMHMRFKGHSD